MDPICDLQPQLSRHNFRCVGLPPEICSFLCRMKDHLRLNTGWLQLPLQVWSGLCWPEWSIN
ncbi:hypothetical protein Cfor_12106 [Coptotermes formosanus]|uniref:Uncharacterized protein n=1 Tax=Coptotermes formosanus TaxID=36987 RepID=A0A6L2PKH6_COPFO|nr:hypothetical protein Cfor_12106 [Coptotermes formosanus]